MLVIPLLKAYQQIFVTLIPHQKRNSMKCFKYIDFGFDSKDANSVDLRQDFGTHVLVELLG